MNPGWSMTSSDPLKLDLFSFFGVLTGDSKELPKWTEIPYKIVFIARVSHISLYLNISHGGILRLSQMRGVTYVCTVCIHAHVCQKLRARVDVF